MTYSFQAQIEMLGFARPPDPWTGGSRLPLDHVISRNSTGVPASRVGDFQWDWSAYKSRGRNSTFNFIYWDRRNSRKRDGVTVVTEDRLSRLRDMQHLMTLLIYKRNGIPLSSSSLDGYFTSLVRIAQFAESRSVSVADVFGSANHLDSLILMVRDTPAAMLFRWWKLLSRMSQADVGFRIVKPLYLEELRKRADDHKKGKKQKAPLPTRIYSEFINALTTELDEIEPIVDQLLNTVRLLAIQRNELSENLGRAEKGIVKALFQKLRASWPIELGAYYERRGYADAFSALNSVLSDIQRVCKLAINPAIQ